MEEVHLNWNDWILPRTWHFSWGDVHYTPQSNRVAERKNRTLINMVNCMLFCSGAPENLYGEALLSACYILNRVPQRDSDITPYEC